MSRFCIFTLFFVFLPGLTHPAWAIVRHKDGSGVIAPEPPAGERPAVGVVGSWTKPNGAQVASVVAVGRPGWETTCYILTVRHMDEGDVTGSTVTLDGNQYKVAANGVYDVSEAGLPVDLRLCRLENLDGTVPNLTDFAKLNFDVDEEGKDIIMGGCGCTVGSYGTDPYGEYYTWQTCYSLNWGANTINSSEDNTIRGIYNSDTVISIFEGPRGSTTEAAIAAGDSGGGWFYQEGDDWYVAGISAYSKFSGKSYFFVDPKYTKYELNYDRAIRVSSYAEDLDDTFSDLLPSVPGDANLDGKVSPSDYTILAANYTGAGGTGKCWSTADFNFDGAVSTADYTLYAENYGYGMDGPTGSAIPDNFFVPEPTVLCFLCLGFLRIFRR